MLWKSVKCIIFLLDNQSIFTFFRDKKKNEQYFMDGELDELMERNSKLKQQVMQYENFNILLIATFSYITTGPGEEPWIKDSIETDERIRHDQV